MSYTSEFVLLGESHNRRSTLLDIFNYYNQNNSHNEIQVEQVTPYKVLKSAENEDLFEEVENINDNQLLCASYNFIGLRNFSLNDYSHSNLIKCIYNHVREFDVFTGIIVVIDYVYNDAKLIDTYTNFMTEIQSILPEELRGTVIYVFTNCDYNPFASAYRFRRMLNKTKESGDNWFYFQSISNNGEEFIENKSEFNQLRNFMSKLPLLVVSNCSTENGRKTIGFLPP